MGLKQEGPDNQASLGVRGVKPFHCREEAFVHVGHYVTRHAAHETLAAK
jgi:hypothetical protein